jgi:hypothetical protein
LPDVSSFSLSSNAPRLGGPSAATKIVCGKRYITRRRAGDVPGVAYPLRIPQLICPTTYQNVLAGSVKASMPATQVTLHGVVFDILAQGRIAIVTSAGQDAARRMNDAGADDKIVWSWRLRCWRQVSWRFFRLNRVGQNLRSAGRRRMIRYSETFVVN